MHFIKKQIDAYHLISKLRWSKIYNATLLYLSYYVAKYTGIINKSYHPFSLSIEPTTACNLSCPHCVSGLKSFTRNTGNMELQLFKDIIDNAYRKLIWLTLYFQGEPFLNRHFLEMVHYATANNIYTSTSTNGHFLDPTQADKTVESGLNRLLISIDGTNQSSYELYRKGGNFEVVKAGIQNIVQAKAKLKSSNPYVVLQFIIFGHNEHEIDEMKSIFKKSGADKLEFKTAQLINQEDKTITLPKNEKLSRYLLNGMRLPVPKNDLTNHCWRTWHSNVITWDGNLLPCCFDKDSKHSFGNIEKHELADLLNNETALNFKKSVFKNRKNIDICKNCTEGIKTKITIE